MIPLIKHFYPRISMPTFAKVSPAMFKLFIPIKKFKKGLKGFVLCRVPSSLTASNWPTVTSDGSSTSDLVSWLPSKLY